MHGDPLLSQAFQSEDAVRLDQSVQTENFCVTLAPRASLVPTVAAGKPSSVPISRMEYPS